MPNHSSPLPPLLHFQLSFPSAFCHSPSPQFRTPSSTLHTYLPPSTIPIPYRHIPIQAYCMSARMCASGCARGESAQVLLACMRAFMCASGCARYVSTQVPLPQCLLNCFWLRQMNIVLNMLMKVTVTFISISLAFRETI